MIKMTNAFVMAHLHATDLRIMAADRVVGLLLAYPERTKANEYYKALVDAEIRTDEAAARGDGEAYERGAAEEWRLAQMVWEQMTKHSNTTDI